MPRNQKKSQYAQWCDIVQLRDGCVLNLESESLRLEAGSALCNSSAFGDFGAVVRSPNERDNMT